MTGGTPGNLQSAAPTPRLSLARAWFAQVPPLTTGNVG